MTRAVLIAILAGLASGVFHLAILAGTLGALIFGYLTALPLFAAGLALGWPAAAIGGLAGLAVVVPVAGLPAGLWYAAIGPLPVTFLVRRALLSRETPRGTAWYPSGYLLSWMAAWASFVLFAIALWQGAGEDGLLPLIERRVGAALSQWDGLFGPQNAAEDAAKAIARIVPMGVGLSWMVMTAINMMLAQGVLGRFGKAIRPPQPFVEFELPRPLMALFAGGTALSLFPDPTSMIGLAVAGLAALPYAIAGIATVHVFANRFGPRRRLALGIFYVGLIFAGWPILALLGALGAIDQWFGLRARLGAANLPTRKEE